MDPYYKKYKKYKSKCKQLSDNTMSGGSNNYSPWNPYRNQTKNTNLGATQIAKSLAKTAKTSTLDIKQSILNKAKDIKGKLEGVKHLISYLNHVDAVQDLNTPSNKGGYGGNGDFGESINKSLLDDKELFESISTEIKNADKSVLTKIYSKKYGNNMAHGLMMSGNDTKLKAIYDSRPDVFNKLLMQKTKSEDGPKYDTSRRRIDRTPFESKINALNATKKFGTPTEEQKLEITNRIKALNDSRQKKNLNPYNEYVTQQEGGVWSWLFG